MELASEAEINKLDGASWLVIHNIFRFDVAMDDADDLLAIVQRFKHVDEEVAHLPIWKASLHWLLEIILITLKAFFCVYTAYLISKAAVRVVLGDKINCTFRIFDHFMKPDKVWVLELLQNFELLLAEIVGGDVRNAYLHSLKPFMVKLFNRILFFSLCVLIQKDFGKAAFTNFSDEFVFV